MHQKFLGDGGGSGQKVVAYLMGDLDHQGNERSYVGLIEGDPHMVADIIDSLPFALRYRSAVVAWHVNDKPTLNEIYGYVEDFKKLAFAGLQPEQYSLLVAMHVEENAATHLHILVPRVDLLSEKSMNISPPGWRRGYNALRDMWNIDKGWARPDDPNRARATVDPGNNLPAAAKNIKKCINAAVTESVEDDRITSRTDVIALVSRFGSVEKLGKDFISVKCPAYEKNIILRGDYFCENYNFELKCKPRAPRPSLQEQYARAMEDFRSACKSKEAYNLEHYPPETPVDILIKNEDVWIKETVATFKPKKKPPAFKMPESDGFLMQYLENQIARAAEVKEKAAKINEEIAMPRKIAAILARPKPNRFTTELAAHELEGAAVSMQSVIANRDTELSAASVLATPSVSQAEPIYNYAIVLPDKKALADKIAEIELLNKKNAEKYLTKGSSFSP